MGDARDDHESIRDFLLSEVLAVVERARRCSGCQDELLVGSLSEDKSTIERCRRAGHVDDRCDLASLATPVVTPRQAKVGTRAPTSSSPIVRTLHRGSAMAECRPGVRWACDARHCGTTALFARRPGRSDARTVVLVRGSPLELCRRLCSCSIPRDVRPACSAIGGSPHTIMRIAPDQRVIRTRANRVTPVLHAGHDSAVACVAAGRTSRPVGAEIETRPAPTPSHAPTTRAALSRRLERSRGRETWHWRYAHPDMTSLAPLGFG